MLKLKRTTGALALLLACSVLNPLGDIVPVGVNAYAAKTRTKSKKRKTATSAAKTTTKKKRQGSGYGIQTVWRSEDGEQWIRKGARGIIISKDSTGTVRAMTPYSCPETIGVKYSEAINQYARELANDSVRIYSLVVPTQGEYYMPEQVSTAGAEQRAIEAAARALDSNVTPVFINDTLKNHLDEEIYNRTDHHWSPLGAYYGSAALAHAAGTPFRPLSDYKEETVRDYVGTMYKFSGDPEVKKAPEEFVYYMPPEGYKSEFITYRLSGNKTVGESEPHEEPFFRKFPDGSGAAYCTFMGGDSRTVKVTNTGGTPGRRLLIVKDSYGNAMAAYLFGSFEEVHVVDFRYFPHNLADYARDNNITDMVFVNSISLAFTPNAESRLKTMLNAPHAQKHTSQSESESD